MAGVMRGLFAQEVRSSFRAYEQSTFLCIFIVDVFMENVQELLQTDKLYEIPFKRRHL